MSQVLDQLDEQSEACLADYVKLVRDAGSPDPQIPTREAQTILRESGKTADDLRRDVKLFHDRQKWVEQLDQGDESRRRVAEIDRLCERKKEELEAARRKFRKEVDEFRQEQRDRQSEVIASHSARDLLQRRHYDESIASSLAELAERRKANSGGRVFELLASKQEYLERLEAKSEAGELVGTDRFQLSDVRKEVARLEERCDELAAESNEINSEIARLEALRMAP